MICSIQLNVLKDLVVRTHLPGNELSTALQLLPSNFSVYLSNPKNKVNFVTFFLETTIEKCKAELNTNQILVVGNLDGSTWEIQFEKQTLVSDLMCGHEEADSRMVLYAAYYCQKSPSITHVIKSDDTDVMLILLFHAFKSLQSCNGIWFLTGKRNK